MKVLRIGNLEIELEEGKTIEELLAQPEVIAMLGKDNIDRVYKLYKQEVKDDK